MEGDSSENVLAPPEVVVDEEETTQGDEQE